MEFRILGPVEVWDGAQRLALGGSKPCALLAVLLLHANQMVSTERLVDELWGEAPPTTARNQVQVYVSRLRQALHRRRDQAAQVPMLVTRPSGYVLRVEPGELDLDCFEDLTAEARRAAADGDLERAAERWCAALALWRGPALAGAASEVLQRTAAARLEEPEHRRRPGDVRTDGLDRSRLVDGQARQDRPVPLAAHHQLAEPLASVPAALSQWNPQLSADGATLTYEFDAKAERTGIPSFLITLGTFFVLQGANLGVTKLVTGSVSSPSGGGVV